MSIEIAGRKIDRQQPPYFVAEIGANHDGDLSRAKKLITLAALRGADAVKFQHFAAETIVSRRGFEELGRMLAHQAAWPKGVYETYELASIPLDWTEALRDCCQENEVALITTPYSPELADLVEPYVDAFKIGSGDVTYHELIRHVAAKGKPVLLATGASTKKEIREALEVVVDRKGLHEYGGGVWPSDRVSLVLMQCTTDYSGRVYRECLNLNVLRTWEMYYPFDVGFSDHTPGYVAACTAVALGACVIEKHFTDDPGRRGPDHGFALSPSDWSTLVETVTATWAALGDGRKKVEGNEEENRIVQRRALRWARDLPSGHVVERDDLVALRPCPKEGVPPNQVDQICGLTLNRDVTRDDLVRREECI